MKRIIALILVLAAMLLVGCSSESTSGPLPWQNWEKEEFLLYDENGKVVQRPSVYNHYAIFAFSPEDGCTYRNVAVGDDAIQALEKYGLFNPDDEEAIMSESGYSVRILLDENGKRFQFKENEDTSKKIYYIFELEISEGKITCIKILKSNYRQSLNIDDYFTEIIIN